MILWRGIELPGHEACRLFIRDSSWHLEGTAVFSHQGAPCRLSYQVLCDRSWSTRTVTVEGWLGNQPVNIQISADTNHRWQLNDIEVPGVTGCLDIDLNYRPSTNLLPIRRLNLEVGEKADITAAWLKFPSFQLEPLAQRYQRLGESLYRYESGGGQFSADLKVNSAGFALDYPGIWVAEASMD